MNGKTAILLLIIYLFGATNACQLLKLPLLVSHYVKHKRERPNTTLGSFFKMHYIDPQPLDADYAQDMQLPFKTIPDDFCRNIPLFVVNLPDIRFKVPVFNKEARSICNDKIPHILLVNTIFQPPRV